MILFWSFVAIVGVFLSMYGSHRLSVEWSKQGILRQAHLTPKCFLIDFETEIKLKDSLQNKILDFCKNKTTNQGKSKDIVLSLFFDQIKYETNKVSEINYSLGGETYDIFTSFNIFSTAVSKDKSLILNLEKNKEKVRTTADRKSKESHLEIIEFDTVSKKFKVLYKNISLDVTAHTLSPFVTDLNNGNFSLNIITKPEIDIVEVKEIYLKTETNKYFQVIDIKKDDIGQTKGKIKLLLN